MIVDEDRITINSQLIVSLAKQALTNTERLSVKSWYGKMPREVYREEFGVVKISMPRQSGHTTAALQLLVEHPGSLAFIMQRRTKDDMLRMLGRYTTDWEVINRVERSIVPISDNALKNVKPLEYRPFIIFDQATSIREDVFEEIKNSYNAGIVVELQ